MIGIVLAYGVVASLVDLVGIADSFPYEDTRGLAPYDPVDSILILNALGYGLLGVAVLGPFYLVLGAVLLAVLRRLKDRGWTHRRLRWLAVISGIVATAPLYGTIPAGAFYGLIVPLPGAGPEYRRRVLVRTGAGVIALLAVLAPLSLVVS